MVARTREIEAAAIPTSATSTAKEEMTQETLQEISKNLWDFTGRMNNTRLIDKLSAPEMQIAAHFLGTMGVIEPALFLSRFTTTIGRSIYAPFTPGEGTDAQCWGQIVTCVHEHQHIFQMDREGDAAFMGRYLFDQTARATYEAEAYRCGLELMWWRCGDAVDLDYLARESACKLRNYGCDEMRVAHAKAFLKASIVGIRHGAVENQSTVEAIDWLEGSGGAWLKRGA